MDPILLIALGVAAVYLLGQNRQTAAAMRQPTVRSTAVHRPPQSGVSDVQQGVAVATGITSGLESIYANITRSASDGSGPVLDTSRPVYGVGPDVNTGGAAPTPVAPFYGAVPAHAESNQDVGFLAVATPTMPDLTGVDSSALQSVDFNQPSADFEQTLSDPSMVVDPVEASMFQDYTA